MKRTLQYDQIDLAPTKITQRDDPLFGPTTIFHDIVIAREIIHQYEDGWAYKPARELKDTVWTAEGRWVVLGRHPDTAVVSSRNDIGGRTVNVRYTKSLIDPKTQRPNNHGILADLEVFDSRVAPDVLMAMKSGTKRDVSIGFFFDEDSVAGTIDEEGHPLNGVAYDYVQRNIMIDHTAAALDTGSGRCTMPLCGIGADAFRNLVTGDPVGHWKTFGACVAAIMKENPDYTREQAEGTCGKIEAKSKDFKSTDDNNLSMSKQEAIDKFIEALDTFKQLFVAEDEVETDDLVEEEYQGNAGAETHSMRAKMFFSISDDEWDALSEEEKNDYISRLPPDKTKAGGGEMSNRDCVYPWDEVREKILQSVPDKDRAKSAPAMLQRIITALVFDGDSVTVTPETREKLIEYGIDLDPCECDDAETDEDAEPDEIVEEDAGEEIVEDSDEQEIGETQAEDTLSTDQMIQETEKVLHDIKRLVG